MADGHTVMTNSPCVCASSTYLSASCVSVNGYALSMIGVIAGAMKHNPARSTTGRVGWWLCDGGRSAVKRATWLVAAALVVGACTGEADNTTTEASPTSTTESATTTVASVSTVETTAAVVEECEEPAAEIAIGAPVESEVPGVDQPPPNRIYFCVQIPEGTTSISVEVSNMTADLNLFMGHPDLATVQGGGVSFWFSQERGTDDKTIVATPGPSGFMLPGRYYIEVSPNDFTEGSTFTLAVTTG